MKLKNFSDYEIDVENGTVWSYKSDRFIGATNRQGYWQVALTDDDGEMHFFRRCRLIYESANGAIPEEMQVNHINETVWDDRLENLNLMTPKQNCNFGTRTARSTEKRSKKVGAYQNGVLVMTFPSTAEAGRQGFSSGHISQCCNGKLKSYRGYQWLYFVDSPPLFIDVA